MKPKKVLKSEEATRLVAFRRTKFAKSRQQQNVKPAKSYSAASKLSILDDQDPSTKINPTEQVHTCAGCNGQIRDRYLLSACNKFWHDSCLRCDRCQAKLGELGSTLYEKSNMNLCRQDYFEIFGRKSICSVCDKLIYASEMVMRAKQNVYHLECFACQLCGLRFCVGDRFHLFENKIVCQYDYDEHILPIQESMQQQQQQDQYQQQTLPADRHGSDNQGVSILKDFETMESERGTEAEAEAEKVERSLDEAGKDEPSIQEKKQMSDASATSAVAECTD